MDSVKEWQLLTVVAYEAVARIALRRRRLFGPCLELAAMGGILQALCERRESAAIVDEIMDVLSEIIEKALLGERPIGESPHEWMVYTGGRNRRRRACRLVLPAKCGLDGRSKRPGHDPGHAEARRANESAASQKIMRHQSSSTSHGFLSLRAHR